jgi:peptidoglycan/xylan/chitin deacetylase (PgdA/CDA1 family)
MPLLLTRRQFIAAAGAWAFSRAAGIRLPRLERALAASPVTLESVPIYLTFDDGVETELAEGKTGPTIDVLDTLDARGVQATFFVHGRNTGQAEGGVLARMIRTGHRVGNHSFTQGGVTVADNPTPVFMAQQYLDTEFRIREVLEPYPDALDSYLSPAHPHLFRRPGGGYDAAGGNLFLLPDSGYWELFKYDDYLAAYRGMLGWLAGVYDYSGWHISPLPLWAEVETPEQVVWWTVSAPNGLDHYLRPLPDEQPEATSSAALEGVIILLHDPDLRVVKALPLLLDALDARGATYHVLPRPVDRPNSYTVGIGRPPDVVMPSGALVDLIPIP